MPPLKIYFDVHFNSKIKDLEQEIFSNTNKLAYYFQGNFIPGFIKLKKEIPIFNNVFENYYSSSYLGTKKIFLDSIESVKSSFQNDRKKGKKKEYSTPQMIKILINKKQAILCLYSNGVITKDMAYNIIIDLHTKYNFKFIEIPECYIFKSNHLDDLINSFDKEDFTAISRWNNDNLLSVKNPDNIKMTDTVKPFYEDLDAGNWTHIKIRNKTLQFEIRINNRTQKFLTFENDYINDEHLVKSVDLIVKKIEELEEFKNQAQTSSQFCIDTFTTI